MASKTNDLDKWANFKQTKQLVKQNLENSIEYCHNRFNKTFEQPKQTWNTINEVMTRNTKFEFNVQTVTIDKGVYTNPEQNNWIIHIVSQVG